MKNKKVLIIIGVILAIIIGAVVILLDDGSVKIGYVEKSSQNSIAASFNYFNGDKNKKVLFEEDKELNINYKLDAKEGNLKMYIKDSKGNILEEKDDEEGSIKIHVKKDEEYVIGVLAEKSKGNFEIVWN